ncbi:DNA cytosine methyltransferase [Streptomyces chattanoogensis]|uniref:Cytosine-specific methyltransferase n=1 Tax=Streptomyces chattanoogensis TaxID=66876 RepID=A0A0N0GXT4_9ACTN|nr:DNA cytosine methyltransferase [Streptomyces chattanoogensis]KPC61339.1 hypothetical protein ADL29_25060 [Streptomyces chattanoogensis]
MAATEPSIGSLFSGIGGLDLGVQTALGGCIAWHAETNPQSAAVLTRHWPGIPNLGDVRTIDWRRVEPVSVVTAGFPCQDLSVAGPRTGLGTGSRSGLWRHIVRAIEALNPCLVVIENVRGLLSTPAGAHTLRHMEPCTRCMGDPPQMPRLRALGVLLADLAGLGYDASWACLRASDIGAPHRRERAFLAAWPAPLPRPAPAAEDADGESRLQRGLPAPRQAQGRRPRPHPCRRGRTPTPDAGLIRPERQGRYVPETQARHQTESCRHSPARWWGEYLPAIRRWERITERAAPTATVPGARRLSAAFVEWMMGLPNGHVTSVPGLSRAAQLRLLGNSVVPPQATHALDHLLGGRMPKLCPQPRGT